MAIPDTNTFSLQDVVDDHYAASNGDLDNNLKAMLDSRVESLFDPTYSGSYDRLSNFRNYQSFGDRVDTTSTVSSTEGIN